VVRNLGPEVAELQGQVRAELERGLPEHLTRLDWSKEQVAAHQRNALRQLLSHALEHSPFHARRLRGVDPNDVEVDDLACLPTMTRADMMANFDDVVTDRRLTRTAVEAHLAASHAEPRLLFDAYVCLASGGSSGQRAVFAQTVGSYVEFVCSLMRRPMKRLETGGQLGGPGLVIALVAAASPVHSTGLGAATSGGPVRLVSAPATDPLAVIVERLNALQPPALMGYPSKLAQLAREQQAGRLRIRPASVTTTSEWLTAEDRSTITAGFGIAVVDQFASTEGLAGLSEPGDSVLTFASDMCLVELVDAEDQPVPPGVPSAKALVTNLHNLTQPLIRYELTDRFVQHPDATSGHLRALVEGRSDDVFCYGTVDVHPLVVRTVMVAAPAVAEYQVHQTRRGVQVSVVAGDDLDVTTLAAALVTSLKHAGLPDPEVIVRRVDAIARHPDTGKARRLAPLPA
jgi:phenylacetate-coenzyme A ligase PaaK-like adenylate-forming protein